MPSGWGLCMNYRWNSLPFTSSWPWGWSSWGACFKEARSYDCLFSQENHEALWPTSKNITDRLRSYRAAWNIIGKGNALEVGRWKNNRRENSHHPFRWREYAILRFRHMRGLQKFVSIHSSVFNHFNTERHLISRITYKVQRETAFVEWRQLRAA